jgi:tetratricopeptide (TPR) repeat protein
MRALLDRIRVFGRGSRARPPKVEVASPQSDPDEPALEALLEDAAAKLAAGDAAAAREAASQALELDAKCARAHLLLGQGARHVGELEEAADCLRLALHFDPGLQHAYIELGAVLKAGGEHDAAIVCYTEGLGHLPASAALHAILGVALVQAGRGQEAEAVCSQAIELDAQLPTAWHNRGYVRLQRGELASALGDFERAIALQPNAAATLSAMAHALRDMGRWDEALAFYGRAIACDPGFADAQKNLAITELLRGELARGWPRYEWRFGANGPPARLDECPVWRGEPLAGKRLLVYREQGIGDEVLFAAMYPDLQGLAAECVFESSRKLAQLFARSFPWARVLPWDARPGWIMTGKPDYQISAGSLGRLLRPSLETFPARRAYLSADEARVARWRERLGSMPPGLKVGFCWRSSNQALERALACTRLQDWQAAFAVPDVQWICLQYDRCDPELAMARERLGARLHRYDGIDYFDDLDEVAALMSALDLVVSTPTTVSLQSAALGVPTWQLTYGADWQIHGTGRNVWLPAIRRFERRWDEQWIEVLSRVGAALQAHSRAAGALGHGASGRRGVPG